MNETDIDSLLMPYADGELPTDQQAVVEAYLAENSEAREQVERWRAVRQTAHRVSSPKSLPSGLPARIAANLARERGRVVRQRLMSGGIMSAAAMVLIAVILWKTGDQGVIPTPPELVSVQVSPVAFKKYHDSCGEWEGHDALHVAGESYDSILSKTRTDSEYRPLIPDLTAQGYRLDGACVCMKIGSSPAMHARYQNLEHPEEFVSVISIGKLISLKGCPEPCDGDGKYRRFYQLASEGQLNIVKWNGPRATYALCGRMSVERLRLLAESTGFDLATGEQEQP